MINEDYFKDDDDKDKFRWIKPENQAYFWYTVLVLVMMFVGLNLDPFIEEMFK